MSRIHFIYSRWVHSRPLVGALWLSLLVLTTCSRPTMDEAIRQPDPTEPDVRVRLSAGIETAAFTEFERLTARVPGSGDPAVPVAAPAQFTHDGMQWRVDGEARPDLGGRTLELTGPPQRPVEYQGRWYPPHLVLTPRRDLPRASSGGIAFDVVAHVPMEEYLQGVLEAELYANWHEQAFRAQAIAARSYAIHRLQQVARGRWYDLQATQVSQVYIGWSGNPRAQRAVRETRGLVLTHQDRIIPAFFHSTCGGIGASPSDAWGGGGAENLPVLKPISRYAWCRKAPRFEWGPIRRDRAALAERFAAWGEANRDPIRRLKRIQTIEVAERNDLGRPTRFVIRESHDQRYELPAEQFRAVCNFRNDAHPLDGKYRLPSAMVTIEPDEDDDSVLIFRGHGFGHGVGLCQYGMQAMAESGAADVTILKRYYPGANVERAY